MGTDGHKKNKFESNHQQNEDVSHERDSDHESAKTNESLELKGILGDTIKKVFTAGVSAAFVTEESIRSYLGELKLPKEVLSLLLQQAAKSKEDLVNKVAREAGQLMSKVDIVKELSRFAENHRFKVTAEIEILPKKKEKEN